MKRICCPNCGLQIEPPPHSMGEVPLEQIVAEDDTTRSKQLNLLRRGIDPMHSMNIAANSPVGCGDGNE